MSTPPGWYRDPHDPSTARYWDGTAWTEQTRAMAAQAPDPRPRPAAPTVPAGRAATPTAASPPPAAAPGGGGSGPGGPFSTGGGDGSRQPWAWAAALAIVAIAMAGFAVFSLTGEAEAEVTLEPVGSTGPDPFTESLAYREVEDHDIGGLGEVEDPRTEGVETALAGRVVTGTAPAVYGGSRDTRVCDVGQLTSFLEDPANADKANAWAGAAGIEAGEIPSFIGGLTAVQLSFATRVTNHGFSDGEANSFQAILQEGTAVLVDNTGAPRVKCNCGNPLLEPSDLGGDGSGALDLGDHASNPDDAWEGLDPAQVVAIRPGDESVPEITLSDFEGDGLLQRPVGSDGASMRDTGTGDVRVKLEWSSDADLDLHVTEPDGTEIWFGAQGPTSTGGQLDVDSNVGCENSGSVENVFWPTGEGPSGTYEIEVVGFSLTGCGGGDFSVTIEVAGQEPEVHTGAVEEDESARFTFTVGSADQGDSE